jgi:hypothetical protein
MLKMLDEITGAMVKKPQFWLSPRMPKVSATIEGETPNRKPYARPDKPETRPSRLGFTMSKAETWARKKTTQATARHQSLLA